MQNHRQTENTQRTMSTKHYTKTKSLIKLKQQKSKVYQILRKGLSNSYTTTGNRRLTRVKM